MNDLYTEAILFCYDRRTNITILDKLAFTRRQLAPAKA